LKPIKSNAHLNAFITVDEDGARQAAVASDERRADHAALGQLDGTPIAVKDNIDTAHLRTTIGTALYAERVPDTDAEVVSKLRAAGAVVVGKTNMAEFACGTVATSATRSTSTVIRAGPQQARPRRLQPA